MAFNQVNAPSTADDHANFDMFNHSTPSRNCPSPAEAPHWAPMSTTVRSALTFGPFASRSFHQDLPHQRPLAFANVFDTIQIQPTVSGRSMVNFAHHGQANTFSGAPPAFTPFATPSQPSGHYDPRAFAVGDAVTGMLAPHAAPSTGNPQQWPMSYDSTGSAFMSAATLDNMKSTSAVGVLVNETSAKALEPSFSANMEQGGRYHAPVASTTLSVPLPLQIPLPEGDGRSYIEATFPGEHPSVYQRLVFGRGYRSSIVVRRSDTVHHTFFWVDPTSLEYEKLRPPDNHTPNPILVDCIAKDAVNIIPQRRSIPYQGTAREQSELDREATAASMYLILSPEGGTRMQRVVGLPLNEAQGSAVRDVLKDSDWKPMARQTSVALVIWLHNSKQRKYQIKLRDNFGEPITFAALTRSAARKVEEHFKWLRGDGFDPSSVVLVGLVAVCPGQVMALLEDSTPSV